MRRLLPLFVVLCGLLFGGRTVLGQDVPSTAPSPGTVPVSGGAPTIASPAPGPQQPIHFNHKTHVQTAKLACNDCHESKGNGTTVAMPQPSKCMLCHSAIATDKPDIKVLADAAKNEDPIAWVRVYRVPSFVTFSHKTHTDSGAKCQDCHGDVAQSTEIKLEKDLHMGGCISCHQAKGAPATCDTCHAIMSKNGTSPMDADKAVLARLHVPVGVQAVAAQGFDWHRLAPRASSLASFLTAPQL